MKKSNKEIYEELSKKYTDEELVEDYLVNEALEGEEQKKIEEEFRRIRLERLKGMSEQEILVSKIITNEIFFECLF